MRIVSVDFENLLSFGSPGLKLEGLGLNNFIVGPNASGKTNLFRALRFVGGVFTRGVVTPEPYAFGFDVSRLVRARVGVRLAQQEVAAMVDLTLAASRMELRMTSRNDIDVNVAVALGGQLLSALGPAVAELYSRDLFFCVTGRDNRSAPLNYFVEFPFPDRQLFLTQNGISNSSRTFSGWQPVRLGEEVVREAEGRHPGVVALGPQRRNVDTAEVDALGRGLTLEWLLSKLQPRGELPVILSEMGLDFTSYEARPDTAASEIENLRRLLRRLGVAVSAISLRDLMGVIFSRAFIGLESLRALPAASSISTLSGTPIADGQVDGQSLAGDLFRLKNSEEPGDRRRFQQLARFFREFSGFDFDVVLESRVGPGAQATTLRPPIIPLSVQDGKLVASPLPPEEPVHVAAIRFSDASVEFSLDRAAAGLYDLLLVLYAALGRTESVVLLDEPAINLHPTVQRQLLYALLDASKQLSNQLFVITHSPLLILPDQARSLIRFERESGETVSHRIKDVSDSEMVRLVSDLERNPKLRSALFARRVLLVEGAAEEAALPIWFSKLQPPLDLPGHGIDVIDVGGNLSFVSPKRILDAWGIPLRIVADNGSQEEVAPFGEETAFCYRYPDLSALMESECGAAVSEARGRVRTGSGSKAPAVAREVASMTAPPPSVQDVARFLRPWVEAS